MRKFFIIFCVVAILFSLSSCQKIYTHGVYEVTITAHIISNDYVGNEWKKVYTCNNETITSGKRWTVGLDADETVIIKATVTEDDEWCDVGQSTLYVDLEDGFETSTIVTVTENGGRYTGNKAKWKITCSVELVKKLEKE